MSENPNETEDVDADEEAEESPYFALTDGHRASHLGVAAFGPDGRPSILEHRFVVENECHGWRLDRFLMKRMRRLSRARIQRVIRGDLDIDGVKIKKPAATVLAGQTVAFRRPAPSEPDVPRTVGVVASDPAFYALDKPAGLPIHPTARYHYGTLTAVLRERFPGESLQVCHRLDRETSGLLLVARSPGAGAAMKRAFARRQVEKTYLALVHGELAAPEIIDAPLGLAGRRVRVQMAVKPVADGGLPSRTRVVPIARYREFTLVEAHPETGRQHQIRAHLAHAGFPIVGDKLYPDDEPFLLLNGGLLGEACGGPPRSLRSLAVGPGDAIPAELMERLKLPRHALHAARLSFPHPTSGAPVALECPLPPDLAAYIDRLAPL